MFFLFNWIQYLPQFDLSQPDARFQSLIQLLTKADKKATHITNYNGLIGDW